MSVGGVWAQTAVRVKNNVKEHTAIRRNIFKSNLVQIDGVEILDALKVLRLHGFLCCTFGGRGSDVLIGWRASIS